MSTPPIQLEKPENIPLGGRDVPTHEIAAIHPTIQHEATHFLVILSNLAGGVSYSIGPGSSVYPLVEALHKWRSFVWVEEDSEALTFFAHDPEALGILGEALQQDHYSHTYSMDYARTTPSWIKVFRNQGERLEALDREMMIESGWLTDTFATPLPEPDEEEDEEE